MWLTVGVCLLVMAVLQHVLFWSEGQERVTKDYSTLKVRPEVSRICRAIQVHDHAVIMTAGFFDINEDDVRMTAAYHADAQDLMRLVRSGMSVTNGMKNGTYSFQDWLIPASPALGSIDGALLLRELLEAGLNPRENKIARPLDSITFKQADPVVRREMLRMMLRAGARPEEAVFPKTLWVIAELQHQVLAAGLADSGSALFYLPKEVVLYLSHLCCRLSGLVSPPELK